MSTLRPRFIYSILLLSGGWMPAQSNTADSPQTGKTGYIQYWPGELPIVLSAPHGGRMLPAELPNRSFGKLMRDAGTLELAQEMRLAMRRQFGKSPHLIICQLARVKLDCNRDIREAAQGHPVAEQAWQEYHDFIKEAEKSALTSHPRGLYLDIHGHAHEKPWLELGYLLSKNELQWPDLRLNKPEVAARSSIRLLDGTSKFTYAELLRGPHSLGGLMEQRGIASVPSPVPRLDEDDLYFTGGYSTETHGSRDGHGLDAIQIETPPMLRNDATQRRNLARALADALDSYFTRHFEMRLNPIQVLQEAE